MRGLPSLLVYRRALPGRQRVEMTFITATTMPLLVALAEIGEQDGVMLPATAASLIGAGVLSVLVYPSSRSRCTGRRRSRPPTPGSPRRRRLLAAARHRRIPARTAMTARTGDRTKLRVASHHPPSSENRPADDPAHDHGDHRPCRHRWYAEGAAAPEEDLPAAACLPRHTHEPRGSELVHRHADGETLTVDEVGDGRYCRVSA